MSGPASSDSLEACGRQIAERLHRAGHTTYWAGGCVRDHLLGRPFKDIDIATAARPEQVQALFEHTHAVGRSFGVILVECGEHTYEVATFRQDVGATDGRRPDAVRFTSPEEDALRRDFTINGLFLDPITGAIHDYVGGRADLERRTIRAIGRPEDRFREDHLRLLRAVRFAATLGFDLDPGTADAMRAQADQLRRISAERIQSELVRLLTESPRAGHGLELLHATGLLPVILPEVEALRGVEQPPEYHPEGDVFRHTVLMLDLMRKPTPELALAVLLHDIGKPATQRFVRREDGSVRIRFEGHAAAGARIATAILQRLRCSNALVEHVALCVRDHMRFMEVTRMRRATLLQLVTRPTFDTELELHRLDCLGSNGNLANHAFTRRFAEEIRQTPPPLEPFLRGEDVMAAGVAAGPEVGRWLGEARDLQWDGALTSRAQALDWLKARLRAPADPDAPPTPGSTGPAGNS